MNNTLTIAQIYGTVGGLFTGQILGMIHIDSLVQPALITFLTTTISFALPILYKRLAKKYNLE